MYDGHDLLARISDHQWPIVALCGIALLCNYAWYIEDIRVARRDRCYTMPPAVTLLYLAHDGSYLLLVGKWWGEYDHWFTQLFWVAIVFTFAGEIVIFVQTLIYGRKELAPGVSQPKFVVLMFVALAATIGAWAAVKNVLGDDLYLVSFMVLIFWAAPFGTAVMLRRASGRGSTPWMWISATMIGVPYGIASVLWFGPAFRSTAWIALLLAAAGWGGYNVLLAHRLRNQRLTTSSPAADDPHSVPPDSARPIGSGTARHS